jgi:hypothetical protein
MSNLQPVIFEYLDPKLTTNHIIFFNEQANIYLIYFHKRYDLNHDDYQYIPEYFAFSDHSALRTLFDPCMTQSWPIWIISANIGGPFLSISTLLDPFGAFANYLIFNHL